MEDKIKQRLVADTGDYSNSRDESRFAAQLDVGPGAVILEGKFARLRPVSQKDYGYLYDLGLSAQNNARWRYRGTTPSPDRFVADLWSGVLAQFLVESPEPRRQAGLVVAYNTDLANGTVFLAVLIDNAFHRKVWPLEGVMLFVDYLFRNWAIRKVYAEAPEFSASHFSSGAQELFEEEGRFREHQFFQGRYWDYIYYSLTRKRWEEQGRKLLMKLSGSGRPG